MSELFAERQGREIASESRVALFRIVQPAKKVEGGAAAFYGVEPEAAAQHGSNIQILQRIRLEIRTSVGKQPGAEIPGITSASLIRVCGGMRRCSGLVVGGIYRIGIKRDIVSLRLAVAGKGHG